MIIKISLGDVFFFHSLNFITRFFFLVYIPRADVRTSMPDVNISIVDRDIVVKMFAETMNER